MTHAASDKRRSREAWPETEPPAEWAPAVHAHDLPSWLRRTMLGIGAFMLLFAVGLGALTYYVYLDHEYVQGRGDFRDAEAERARQQTTEQIRAGICDLLDGLPAGPLLDPKREQYGCGPGVLVAELPPEAQEQLNQFSSGLVEPEPQSVTRPDQPAVSPQDAPAAPPPTADTPEPAQEPPPGLPPVAPAAPNSPTRPPLVDLNPITDPLCDALGVCL